MQCRVTVEDCGAVCGAGVRQWAIAQTVPAVLPVVFGLLWPSVDHYSQNYFSNSFTLSFRPSSPFWFCNTCAFYLQ